jgi:hypothetical protein
MMERTIGWKLEELDRMLNDPAAPPMEAHRVWSLLDDVSARLGCEDRGEAAQDVINPF